MTGRKPTFLERLFGIGSKPEPAEPTPPAHKEPSSDVPKRRLPPQGPAKKAPRSRKRPPKEGTKGGGKPKGPPPAGPAATPGRTPLDERAPGTRKKGTPETSDDEKPAPETTKPRHKAPPPAGPAPAAPAKEAGPTAPSPARQKPKSELKPKPPAPESKRSWFAQLRHGLSRTSNALSDNLASVLTKRKLDDDTLNELEEVLIKADLGTGMADRIRATLAGGRYDKGLSADAVREVLAREIADALEKVAEPLELKRGAKPHVILVVGVNGTGKTTTIGKMAHQFSRSGASVMLAAADTFRAAAIDQLKIWGERVGAEVVAKEVGADPAGVAYEALMRARAERKDVLLVDTAGRLQNKSDLMAELAKIVRVLMKLDADAPHSVVLILDATTGQNAINQVQTFQEIAGVTSLVVTKLDGTARGGILVAIAERFGLPINAIGIGEGLEDFEPFEAHDFARAIAGARSDNEAAA